jgi:hypothetical protein
MLKVREKMENLINMRNAIFMHELFSAQEEFFERYQGWEIGEL